MIIAGLTGSIGMGKSAATQQLRRLGAPVFDADAAVHRALGPGGCAVQLVEKAFPGVTINGAVDRTRLSARVFRNKKRLKKLESILHPVVVREKEAFIRRMRARRKRVAILDMPLLFEIGADKTVDAILVVSCPAFLQTQRVMARKGMTARLLAEIRTLQTPDQDKRRRADFVIPSGAGRRFSLRKLTRALAALKMGKRISGNERPKRYARNRS